MTDPIRPRLPFNWSTLGGVALGFAGRLLRVRRLILASSCST